MPTYTLHPLAASVIVTDAPLGYAPARGPRLDFQLWYNQRVYRLGQTPTFAHVAPLWSVKWLSYVMDNNTTVVAPYTWTFVLLRGEGTESYNPIDG
jgi:hypothetical protein